MKSVFKCFVLAKAGAFPAGLELLRALGSLIGLKFHFTLLVSAGGQAILIFLGVAIRIKVRDTLWVSLPALFFMVLNAYNFFISLHL